MFYSVISTTIFRGDDGIIFRRLNPVPCTLSVGSQFLIQNDPLSYTLVLLSPTYMGNCVIAYVNILSLLDLCTGYLKATGKETSPIRSRILPSPILFKKVTVMKNSCSLDDFLVAKSFIK